MSGGMEIEEQLEDGFRAQFGSIEAWRGAASNAWQVGADGICLYNLFPKDANHPVFVSVGEQETLNGLNKIFAVDNRREYYGGIRQGLEQEGLLPINLDSPGLPPKVGLPIGDDIAGAAISGRLRSARLGVKFSGLSHSQDRVEVRLNDRLLSVESAKPELGWFVYRPEPGAFRLGDNTVEFRVTRRSVIRAPVIDEIHPHRGAIWVTVVEALVEYERPAPA